MWSGARPRWDGVQHPPAPWEHLYPGHSLGDNRSPWLVTGGCVKALFFWEKCLWWCSPALLAMLSCLCGLRWGHDEIMVSWGFQSDLGLLAPLPGTPRQSAAAPTTKGRWPRSVAATVTPPVIPLRPAPCSPGSSPPPVLTPNHHLPGAGWEQLVLPPHPRCDKIWQNRFFPRLLRSPEPTLSHA